MYSQTLADKGRRGEHEHQRLMAQRPIKASPINIKHCVEGALAGSEQSTAPLGFLRLEKVCAHHRRQDERYDSGNDDGSRKRDGEFAEQPTDDASHEQQRDEDRNQRDRQRNNCEAYLPRSLEGGLQRPLAFLDEPDDILDHDDCVVHDESGSDAQGHQRKIVQAKAYGRHHRKRGDQRHRQGHGRDDGRPEFPQEKKDHQDHQTHGNRQSVLNFDDRCADRGRAIAGQCDAKSLRRRFLNHRQ